MWMDQSVAVAMSLYGSVTDSSRETTSLQIAHSTLVASH
jgi:hypothetical protein